MLKLNYVSKRGHALLLPGVNVYVNGVLDIHRDIATGNTGFNMDHKVLVTTYGSTAMYASFLDGEYLPDMPEVMMTSSDGNHFCIMMTSSNGNNFRVTGLFCGEFTGHRWIHLTKASDAVLWCFLICVWIKSANNGDDGEIRHHRAHYDVTIMGVLLLFSTRDINVNISLCNICLFTQG